MIQFLARRAAAMIPAIFLVITVVFFLVQAIPGDPVKIMLWGSTSTPERVEEIRHQLGLDQPVHIQYWNYISSMIKGDLGNSIRSRKPVGDEIKYSLPGTLQLTLAGMAIATFLGFSMGLVAALKENSWVDSLVTGLANLGAAMPAFWLGIMLIYVFAVVLGWLPASSGADSGLRGIILPAIALGWTFAGVIARLVRASVIEVMTQDYVRVARAKGLREKSVVWRHALRNALIPVVTVMGMQFGNMMATSVVVEVTFARPGMGRLIVQAILDHDFPLIQGSILVISLVYLFANLLVDLSYPLLDPRIRHA